MMRKILIYFYQKYDGDQQLIFQALRNKEQVAEEDLVDLNENDYITILDDNYPNILKTVVQPPIVLPRNLFELN